MFYCLCVCERETVCLPNRAPTASPAVCGLEKAAMALKMSGAPLPRARNVTPSAQTPVKEHILHEKNNNNKNPEKNLTVESEITLREELVNHQTDCFVLSQDKMRTSDRHTAELTLTITFIVTNMPIVFIINHLVYKISN